jgi:signal transduction histidine kinase
MDNERILLVDDEESIRFSLQRMLTKKGYSVDTAESGESAIEKCKDCHYDLVISDIMMEGMTGVELLKQIISLDPEASVILLTGFGTLETAVEALRIGAADYLQKPCDKEELSLRAEKSLEKQGLKKQLNLQNNQLLQAKANLEQALIKSQKAEEELFRSHQKLEERVTSRTLELSEAKKRAEKSDQAKSEFLTHMSHELRTPLNAILGFAQLMELSNKEPLSQNQRSQISEIIKGGEHLLTLINDVLDLARVESGNIPLSLESVELGEVIDEVFTLLKPLANEKTITISNQVKSWSSFVLADRTRLKQLLLNLCSNAIKYNKENGTVVVSTKTNDKDMIIINIMDTGIGIPDDQLKEIFKPFKRVTAMTESIEGTGIGLAFSIKLLEKLNGRLSVQSSLGEGSIFTMELPRGEPQSLPIKTKENQGQTQVKPTLNKFKILYIEDNPINLKLVQSIFSERDDIELFSAHEALLGIEIAQHQMPDLILMDINLPGMSGIEAFKKLQTWKETRDIPVIAVSANAMEKDVKIALTAGMHAYITKPINVPKFNETISKIMNAN